METFLVGGAVRDRLLGLPVRERDWVVVGATPAEMEALGFRQVGRDFPVFLHPETSEEYALARTERKSGRGHRGFVVHSDPSVTLEQDLQRRDLTINAMAEKPGGELVDPYGGQADLAGRLLRHVSPAFVEDPLRVLRVARFAARFAHLGFTVAAETLDLMRAIADSGELGSLSPERVWNETDLALATGSPQVFLAVLEDCGALPRLLPELVDSDAARSRLAAAAAASADGRVRFAALAADLSPSDASRLGERLHAPNRYTELATLLATLGARLRSPAPLEPEARLEVLEQADAFRRPDRFELLLQAAEALVPDDAACGDSWRRDLAACADVDAAAIAAAGISGRDIGKRVRAERLARLAG